MEVVDRFAVDIYFHSNALEGTISAEQTMQALGSEPQSQYTSTTMIGRTSRSGRRSFSASGSAPGTEPGLRPIQSGQALNELVNQAATDPLVDVVGEAHAAPLRRHLAIVRIFAGLTAGFATAYLLRGPALRIVSNGDDAPDVSTTIENVRDLTVVEASGSHFDFFR